MLRSAQRLMLRHGYSATSVEMICEASQVSKGVFFHYFDSKKALGVEALRTFFEEVRARLTEDAERTSQDPMERLQALVRGMLKILSSPRGPQGCLIATFTIETADREPELRRLCADYFRQWAQLLSAPLEQAIDQYAPQLKLDAQQLSYYCISIIEGSLLLSRAHQDPAVIEHNTELLIGQIQGLLGRSAPGANRAGPLECSDA